MYEIYLRISVVVYELKSGPSIGLFNSVMYDMLQVLSILLFLSQINLIRFHRKQKAIKTLK